MDTNIPSFFQPFDKCIQTLFRQPIPKLTGRFVDITEIRSRVILFQSLFLLTLPCFRASELSDIENLNVIFKPLEISGKFVAEVRFASGRKSHLEIDFVTDGDRLSRKPTMATTILASE